MSLIRKLKKKSVIFCFNSPILGLQNVFNYNAMVISLSGVPRQIISFNKRKQEVYPNTFFCNFILAANVVVSTQGEVIHTVYVSFTERHGSETDTC